MVLLQDCTKLSKELFHFIHLEWVYNKKLIYQYEQIVYLFENKQKDGFDVDDVTVVRQASIDLIKNEINNLKEEEDELYKEITTYRDEVGEVEPIFGEV